MLLACSFRPDFEQSRRFFGDTRPIEEVEAQYRLERKLASRLKQTPVEERGEAYIQVYDELYSRLPDVAVSRSPRLRRVRFLTKRLLHRLDPSKSFLEIGCGDAILTQSVAVNTARSYALDVTDACIDRQRLPANVEVIISRGGISLPSETIDYAFSDQVMEHLHPDDAIQQLREIFRVLKPGGSYHCITPNRVVGPHDVSVFFDYEATGLHLREYDSRSLVQTFKQVGFRKVRFFVSAFGYEVPLPASILKLFETVLLSLPGKIRARSSRFIPIILFAGLDAIATK